VPADRRLCSCQVPIPNTSLLRRLIREPYTTIPSIDGSVTAVTCGCRKPLDSCRGDDLGSSGRRLVWFQTTPCPILSRLPHVACRDERKRTPRDSLGALVDWWRRRPSNKSPKRLTRLGYVDLRHASCPQNCPHTCPATDHYVDASNTRHGFLYNGSTYITLDPPGSTFTVGQAINDSGEVTGYYTTTVSEPSALAVLGASLAALAAFRRRRNRYVRAASP
jgi:hypothetical protein